jgi:hypothetical protein
MPSIDKSIAYPVNRHIHRPIHLKRELFLPCFVVVAVIVLKYLLLGNCEHLVFRCWIQVHICSEKRVCEKGRKIKTS